MLISLLIWAILGGTVLGTFLFLIGKEFKRAGMVLLGGFALLWGIAAVLPEKPQPAAASNSPPATGGYSSTPQKSSVDVTLRNYKEKGDSVPLECSGPTGRIVCKPK